MRRSALPEGDHTALETEGPPVREVATSGAELVSSLLGNNTPLSRSCFLPSCDLVWLDVTVSISSIQTRSSLGVETSWTLPTLLNS